MGSLVPLLICTQLSAFVKALIPNLKSYNPCDPIDISKVKLSHYKLHKQKKEDINLYSTKLKKQVLKFENYQ